MSVLVDPHLSLTRKHAFPCLVVVSPTRTTWVSALGHVLQLSCRHGRHPALTRPIHGRGRQVSLSRHPLESGPVDATHGKQLFGPSGQFPCDWRWTSGPGGRPYYSLPCTPGLSCRWPQETLGLGDPIGRPRTLVKGHPVPNTGHAPAALGCHVAFASFCFLILIRVTVRPLSRKRNMKCTSEVLK